MIFTDSYTSPVLQHIVEILLLNTSTPLNGRGSRDESLFPIGQSVPLLSDGN